MPQKQNKPQNHPIPTPGQNPAPRTCILALTILQTALHSACATQNTLIPITGNDLMKEVRSQEAPITLVNVWATWCEPCVEEFPDLLSLRNQYSPKGVRFIFISVDQKTGSARAFLESSGAGLPSYIKKDNDGRFIESLNPRWSGTLPATLLYSRGGRLEAFWQGPINPGKISQHINGLLAKAP